jgi:hypothetical protein
MVAGKNTNPYGTDEHKYEKEERDGHPEHGAGYYWSQGMGWQ